jgi:NADH:ubiquinone oxidoreductase subunit K
MAHGDGARSPFNSLDIEAVDKRPELLLDVGVTWRNWVNLVAFLINLTVTQLSNLGVWGLTNTVFSRRYQTLITPKGTAFVIWAFIFLWEIIFTAAQFLPGLRNSKVTRAVSPWWWAVCFFQTLWNFAFAQELIPLAAMLMLGILLSLIGISWSIDGVVMDGKEWILLRAPFSLQLGWIIAAAALNLNVVAEYYELEQSTMLGLAIVSLAAVAAMVFCFTFTVKSADPFVGCVACWACAFISKELSNTDQIKFNDRFQRKEWPEVVLDGVGSASFILSLCSLYFAVVALVRLLCGDDLKCTRPVIVFGEQAEKLAEDRARG